jgi:hypothetical protein
VKVLTHNPLFVIVEIESRIGKLRPSLEIRKRWAGDSKIGSEISPPAEARKDIKTMVEKFGKPKTKKLSKRKSLENWRLKEAARAKAKAIANNPQSRQQKSVRVYKKQDQS